MADSDKKTTKELAAIAEKEAAEAIKAEQDAEKAVAKALKEEQEANAAKAALAKRVAAEAGTPVNKPANADEAALQEAWVSHCIRFGYNRSTPRPADWTGGN